MLAAAERAGAAGDRNGQAIDLARAAETACRFPDAFPVEIPRERVLGLLDRAAAVGDPGAHRVALPGPANTEALRFGQRLVKRYYL